LPILKREKHRQALIRAATSNNHKFFLGTDTAPHFKTDKESACGCAGIFNATNCISILAEVFERNHSLKMLENFVSINGARHYNCDNNIEKLKLKKLKHPLNFKKYLKIGNNEIIIFEPDFPVFWEVQGHGEP
jgi:dihydroorotase